MANIQIRIDDATKVAADSLFNSLGLDISTAVRMFIASALDHNGLPFEVKKTKPVAMSARSDSSVLPFANGDGGKFSKEYLTQLREMWKNPDPTFIEQPEPHFTDRGGFLNDVFFGHQHLCIFNNQQVSAFVCSVHRVG